MTRDELLAGLGLTEITVAFDGGATFRAWTRNPARSGTPTLDYVSADEAGALPPNVLSSEHPRWPDGGHDFSHIALACGPKIVPPAAYWARVLGLGYHPDTRADDYEPALSPEMRAAYAYDHDRVGPDYDAAIAEWERLGLIE